MKPRLPLAVAYLRVPVVHSLAGAMILLQVYSIDLFDLPPPPSLRVAFAAPLQHRDVLCLIHPPSRVVF